MIESVVKDVLIPDLRDLISQLPPGERRVFHGKLADLLMNYSYCRLRGKIIDNTEAIYSLGDLVEDALRRQR